jgi:hypothetical protein
MAVAPVANTYPTPVSFWGAVRLCVLLLCFPERFQAAEEADNEALRRASHSGSQPPTRPRSSTIRHALIYSGGLVLISATFGFLAGALLGNYLFCGTPKFIMWLQIVGTCLLLWGTLFVRGWEIQTYGGVTLTERVNQWLYRSLYCAGTAVLVSSLAWTVCPAVM